jgi:hypothetical protein
VRCRLEFRETIRRHRPPKDRQKFEHWRSLAFAANGYSAECCIRNSAIGRQIAVIFVAQRRDRFRVTSNATRISHSRQTPVTTFHPADGKTTGHCAIIILPKRAVPVRSLCAESGNVARFCFQMISRIDHRMRRERRIEFGEATLQ